MPHHNCHLIESRLRRAEEKLKELRTNINIHEQYLKTHPGHAATQNLLKELHALEHQQEAIVENTQSELDVCEAQNDMEDEKHDKEH
jgi:3-hydroxyacyl-CoA dehydrogenase